MKNKKQPLGKYLCLPFYPDLCLIHTHVSYEEFSNSLSKEIGSKKIPCNSLALGNVIYCSLTLGNYCVSSIKTTLEAACKLPSYFSTKAPIEDAYELAVYLFTNGPIYAQNTFESSKELMNKACSVIDCKSTAQGFVAGAALNKLPYFDPLIKIGAGIATPLFTPAKASFILGEVLGAVAAEAASPTLLWNVAKCGAVTVVASACIGTASAIYFNREEISDEIYSSYMSFDFTTTMNYCFSYTKTTLGNAIDYTKMTFNIASQNAYELAGYLFTNGTTFVQNTFESGKELISRTCSVVNCQSAVQGFVAGGVLDQLPLDRLQLPFDYTLIKIGAGAAFPFFNHAKVSFFLGEILGATAAEAVAKCGTVTVVASTVIGTASAIYFNREEISDKIYSMYEHIMGEPIAADVLGANQAGSHAEQL